MTIIWVLLPQGLGLKAATSRTLVTLKPMEIHPNQGPSKKSHTLNFKAV